MNEIQPSAARTSRLWSTTCPLARSEPTTKSAATRVVQTSWITRRRVNHRRVAPSRVHAGRGGNPRAQVSAGAAAAIERALDELAHRHVDLAGGLLGVEAARPRHLPEEAVRLGLVGHRPEL